MAAHRSGRDDGVCNAVCDPVGQLGVQPGPAIVIEVEDVVCRRIALEGEYHVCIESRRRHRDRHVLVVTCRELVDIRIRALWRPDTIA